MRRRKALSLSVTGLTGLYAGSYLIGCSQPIQSVSLFSTETTKVIEILAEMIIPRTTASGGASDAGVADFVMDYCTDCITEKNRSIILEGLKSLNNFCLEKYLGSFQSISDKDRVMVLENLIAESKGFVDPDFPHFFSLLKKIIVKGYFTSEVGMTESLRYLPIPGDQKGSFPLAPGDKLWAL